MAKGINAMCQTIQNSIENSIAKDALRGMIWLALRNEIENNNNNNKKNRIRISHQMKIISFKRIVKIACFLLVV
ncbi:hypothetical protein DERF_001880 [Dermatophagoides farinae]|uniref:Uncharacterized protein n=1 Tax=Dermatophagoides farinae TaxID=6954 RepID=A0A922L933_DERFA|nr:hypothetical protein DERF_001880 [Dermatophagoides farinae]